MKTFTTYAEKKAKQILNLLQGYTKGIRMTAILILLLMGVSNAWAANITGGTTLYLKPNSNWTKDGARFAAYLCNGSSSAEWYSMSDCNGDGIYEMTVNDDKNHKNIIFCRMNPNNGTNDWAQKWNQTGDLTWNGTNNLYTMTTGSWDAGSWSKKSVTWDLAGDMNDWKNTANQLSGSPLSVSVILEENTTYEFKLHNSEGCWWGNTGTMERNNCSGWTMTHGLGNCKITTDISGTYKFSFDASTKKLTVTYPEECYLKGEFNYWANTSSLMNGSTTINLAANTIYKFKIHNYGATSESWHGNDGTMTRDNCTNWTMDKENDCQITTDFAGDYKFIYDRTTQKLSVTYPAAYTVTYGVGTTKGTTSVTTDPSITSGSLVLASTSITFSKGTTKTGYQWKNWNTNANGTGTNLGTNATYTSSNRNANTTVYACYDLITYNIIYNLNGGTGATNTTYNVESATITLPTAPTQTGYTFAGWYDNANLTGNKVTQVAKGSTGDKAFWAKWTPNTYTITYKDQGGSNFSGEHASGYPTKHTYGVEPTLKSATRTDYTFEGWHTDAACTNKVSTLGATEYTADITLYAKWIPYGDCVFFKNNLNWDEVYVYFYSSDKYWTDDKGTGAHKQSEFPMNSDHRPYFREFRGKMTRIGLTDIWYFDYISAAKQIDPTYWAEIKESKDIAFTAHEQHGHSFFDNTKVIRRGDFKPDMQLFVPQTDQTPTYLNKHDGVSTRYYNKGLWMIYNSTKSGYNWSSDVGNWDNSKNYFTSEIAGGYSFTAEVELNAGSTYEFKIHNQNGTWFGKNGTMTQDNCTNWWFKEEVNDNAKIKPTVTDTYIFTVYLGDGKVMVSLDYPLSVGDYRLAYLDKTANSFHPGHYIKKRNTSKNDTVSFFIHHDKQPQVIAQRCTAIDNNGNAKWETITALINPASSITETGVYNFTLQQIEGRNDPQLLNQARPYTGNYYIRTDAAPGGWKSFRQEGNMMTYNSYADTNEDFDHYFCEWVSQEKGLKNVKYTVANDYSYCISDTLSNDTDQEHPKIVTDKEGDLPKDNKGNLMNANVRWGWDSKTNKIRRAYIAGSGHKKDRFLVLEGNSSLLDVNGKRFTGNTAEGQDRYNLKDDEVVFDDMGNWIYQIDVKANKDTEIDLTALYNGKTQYFKSGASLIVTTAGNTNYYKMRLIYDFKINKLIIAWLPDETDTQELEINMMIIRHNQEQAQQVNFKEGATLTGIKTAYAVMTFDKYFLNNKDSKTGVALPQANEKSENERKFYWVSFPFDVKLSEVFGFGEYGDQWIMEYYDGEARAKEGYWAETETFWKYITNKNYVLKAGQGYVLCLNLNKMGFTSTVFAHTTEVSLYFPSTGPLNTITGELPTAVTVPAHECTIERDNRNIYDSNWNLIGVPGFADIEEVTIGGSSHTEFNDDINADCVSFYYKYLPATNKYDATNNEENFQTMYAYMVQFAGTINWRAKTMPAQLAARRTGSMPSQHDLRLEIAQGEQTDQTFVQLKEEDATAEFDMNVDMTKIFNSGMNIYTLTGSNAIQVAGNALPIAKATIPVGVVTATAGEYTFRMPDGTDGIAVTLVDNVTGTHTNMLMNEYTVTLNAGTIENRFYLVVDPDRTATSVENIGEEADKAKGVEKFLIDGKLFIRTADGIFDAKGQRL